MNATTVVLTLNRKAEIVDASAPAARLFGADRGALSGVGLADLLVTPYDELWKSAFDLISTHDGGAFTEPEAREDRRQVVAQRRDGSIFPVQLVTLVLDGDTPADPPGPGYIAIVHDLTRQRQLERRLRDAEEEERRRIARELHDSVGGQLTGIEIASALLHRSLEQEGSEHTGAVRELIDHLGELHARLRAVSRGLLPVEEDPIGLMTALRRLAAANHGRNGTRCRFRCDTAVEVPDAGIATNLYHIAEEAVRNAVRHAEATHIVVELSERRGEVLLKVRDDGIGIPDDAGMGDGIGMDSMNQRASLIGATLDIGAAEQGTTVRCSVALPEESEQER